MSILIKGMEMPQSCNACMFDVYGLCLINKNIEGEDELTHSCPLVEVQPHGRLIDADALLARFEKEEKAAEEHGRDFSFSFKSGGENCTEWWAVQQMLMDAPTIIKAEEDT